MGRVYELDWLLITVEMNEKYSGVNTLKQKDWNVL
jgi:hypothetical protein